MDWKKIFYIEDLKIYFVTSGNNTTEFPSTKVMDFLTGQQVIEQCSIFKNNGYEKILNEKIFLLYCYKLKSFFKA